MKGKSLKINTILSIIKQICSIIFPLITFPYISRVLGAENYGKYSFGNSIIGYFSLISSLGISTYAIREGAKYRDDKEKINNFCSEIFSFNLVTCFISYILLSISLVAFDKLHSYRLLIAVQSLVMFLNTIGTDWINSIYEDYLYITTRYIIFQVLSFVLLFILVKNKDDYLIYALIGVISSAGANVINFFHVRKNVNIRITSNLNLKKNLLPILILFGNILASTIYTNSDITLIGIFEGDHSVGIYNMAVRIYTIIRQTLATIVIVSLPRLSNEYEKDKRKFEQTASKILAIIITILTPTCVGMFCLSDEIVLLMGGAEYYDSISVLKILSVSLFGAVLAGFYTTNILLPSNNEKKYLWMTILSAVINLGLNFAAITYLGIRGAAYTTAIAEWFVFICGYYGSKKIYMFKQKRAIIIPSFVGSLLIIAISFIIKAVIKNTLVIIFFTVLFSIMAYFLISCLLGNTVVKKEIETIKISIEKFLRGKK